MKIPSKIREAMQQEINHHKGYIEFLGIYHGKTAWLYNYEEPVSIGPPSVYLFDGNRVEYLCGEEVFDIILQFEKS